MSEFQEFNKEVGDIWDANADFWNERMGEGNDFHSILIGPAQERLLDLREDELVLDIACGNGQFARRMAQLGARVVASDIAPRMVEIAKSRTTEYAERIEYRVLDATDSDALLALGERRFDAAVCTMAIMDMARIEPLLSALSRLLKAGGRFVFSVTHPCFNSGGVSLVAEEKADEDGVLTMQYYVKIGEYITPKPAKGEAMRGQPRTQYYFDRPIGLLFKTCFDAGFVLDGLEEPAFPTSRNDSRANWANFTEIPPALVARMRLLS